MASFGFDVCRDVQSRYSEGTLQRMLSHPDAESRRAAVLAKGPRRIQMNLLRNLSADQLVDALVALGYRKTEAEGAAERAREQIGNHRARRSFAREQAAELIGVAVVFWLATAFWVFRDARRRSAHNSCGPSGVPHGCGATRRATTKTTGFPRKGCGR
mgnify:CR=1 FL=1